MGEVIWLVGQFGEGHNPRRQVLLFRPRAGAGAGARAQGTGSSAPPTALTFLIQSFVYLLKGTNHAGPFGRNFLFLACTTRCGSTFDAVAFYSVTFFSRGVCALLAISVSSRALSSVCARGAAGGDYNRAGKAP